MKSEIEVPEGWEVKRLDEITTIIISNVDKKKYENEMPVSLCNYKDVYDNHYINSKLNFMNGTAKKVEIEKFTLLKNDVIITKDSETKIDIANSSVVIEELKNVICGYHLAILRPAPSILNGIFLMNVLKIKPVNNHFVKYAQGLTRFGLTVDAINRAKIPFPPLEEQQKIADILSEVDEQIELTEKIIDKTEELKKGLMQKLLTKGIGHTKFRETEFGEIPEEWEVAKLGDYADITKLAGFEYTKYFNSYKDGGKIIVVRGTNITNNKLDLNNIKTIPKETSEKLPRSQLKKGDLVFAYVGTIGPVYLIKETNKFHLGPNTARITVNENIDSQYAFHYFTSYLLKREIFRQISVSAQPSLSMTKIRSFRFVLPKSMDEQKQIASILSKVDEHIQDNKKELKHLKELKKGLMQDLLTGKVRVSV